MGSKIVIKKFCVGFEVPTAMTKDSTIFWDVTLCNPTFHGTYCLHLQGRKIVCVSLWRWFGLVNGFVDHL
jgi:hypothetical protein